MLAVKPITDRAAATEIACFCGVELQPCEFTYFAADVNENATKINYIIGVCTLMIKGERNELTNLTCAPGIKDDEAMLIMARAALNFMYRCEVKKVTAGDGVPDRLARRLGFKGEDRALDLVEFYNSPCKQDL